MHMVELCFPLKVLLFSHNNFTTAHFLPIKISYASQRQGANAAAGCCAWEEGAAQSRAVVERDARPRWATKIPFDNSLSPVGEALSTLLSKTQKIILQLACSIYCRARHGTKLRPNANRLQRGLTHVSVWSVYDLEPKMVLQAMMLRNPFVSGLLLQLPEE